MGYFVVLGWGGLELELRVALWLGSVGTKRRLEGLCFLGVVFWVSRGMTLGVEACCYKHHRIVATCVAWVTWLVGVLGVRLHQMAVVYTPRVYYTKRWNRCGFYIPNPLVILCSILLP